jgi:hypothetical protein
MARVSDLHVEVQANLRRIVVTMPPTAYVATFVLITGGLGLLSGFGPDDAKAPITSYEFIEFARIAATQKARELGWLTEEQAGREHHFSPTRSTPARALCRLPPARLGPAVCGRRSRNGGGE